MNFFAPSVLWGMLAISLPIIIHFYSRFKAINIEFSTLQFIKKLKTSSMRRLRIKELLLMLIRILIITSTVLMISQPFTSGYIPGWLLGDQKREVNIIIDNSATMKAKVGNKTLLEKSKDSSISLLSVFPKNTKISLIQSCPKKVLFKGEIDDPILPSIIRSIKQTYKFDDIWQVIESFVIENGNLDMLIKECVIFSDFYYAPDSNFLNQNFNKDNWKFYFIYPKEIIDNLSLQSSKSTHKVKALDELVNINVRILNNGIKQKSNIPIELLFDEHRVGQVVANFDPNEMKDFVFKAYPGRQGIIEAKLILPNDDYSSDNYGFIAMPVMEKIKCAIIASSQEEINILKIILSAIDPLNQFLFIETRLQPNINRLFVDEMDVIIIHNPFDISDDAILSLNNYLNDGGGLIWFQGDSLNVNADNRLTNSLGFPKTSSIKKVGSESSFFDIEYYNDRSMLFSDLKIKSFDTELPQIFSYIKTILTNKHNLHMATNTGDALLLDFKFGSGKVFYFSTILDLKWNDLPIKGILIPLLYKMLMISGTDEINTAEIPVGELKVISIDQNLIRSKWEVISPSGEKFMIVPDFNKESIKIKNTYELGIYKVLSDGDTYTSFATTLHEKEQLGNVISPKILSGIIPYKNMRWISIDMKNFLEYFSEIRHGKALWKIFLFIGIVFVFIESIIGRPNKKNMKS